MHCKFCAFSVMLGRVLTFIHMGKASARLEARLEAGPVCCEFRK